LAGTQPHRYNACTAAAFRGVAMRVLPVEVFFEEKRAVYELELLTARPGVEAPDHGARDQPAGHVPGGLHRQLPARPHPDPR
jgi:hypothetical protein